MKITCIKAWRNCVPGVMYDPEVLGIGGLLSLLYAQGYFRLDKPPEPEVNLKSYQGRAERKRRIKKPKAEVQPEAATQEVG